MTRARLEKLLTLTRGAAVLGIGIGAGGSGALGCDHAAGDAPVSPGASPSAVAPQSSAPVLGASDDTDADGGPIRHRRFPVPNAMPRRPFVPMDDAGAQTPAAPTTPPPKPPVPPVG